MYKNNDIQNKENKQKKQLLCIAGLIGGSLLLSYKRGYHKGIVELDRLYLSFDPNTYIPLRERTRKFFE